MEPQDINRTVIIGLIVCVFLCIALCVYILYNTKQLITAALTAPTVLTPTYTAGTNVATVTDIYSLQMTVPSPTQYIIAAQVVPSAASTWTTFTVLPNTAFLYADVANLSVYGTSTAATGADQATSCVLQIFTSGSADTMTVSFLSNSVLTHTIYLQCTMEA